MMAKAVLAFSSGKQSSFHRNRPLYAALEVNHDLSEPFRNRCNLSMVAVSLPPAAQAPPFYAVAPPGPATTTDPSYAVAPPIPATASGPHRSNGKRCGDACIPQNRVCHVEDGGHIAGTIPDLSG